MQFGFCKSVVIAIVAALAISAVLPLRISHGDDFLLCFGFAPCRDRNRLNDSASFFTLRVCGRAKHCWPAWAGSRSLRERFSESC